MTLGKAFLLATGACVGLGFLGDAAMAQRGGGGGGGRMGDTFIDDAVKNPRFIEPYADHDPARYRIGAPREGYNDRQAAARGYYIAGSGYYPAPPWGRVYVQPYGGW